MPERTKTRRPPDKFASAAAFLLFWGVIIGGFALLSQGYEDYTGRAQAEVTRVEKYHDGTGYYVDYRADGHQHTDVPLEGSMGSGITDYGTTITVAYDPADPGDPITAATIEGTPWGAAAAIAMLVGGVGCAVTAVVRRIRRRAEPERGAHSADPAAARRADDAHRASTAGAGQAGRTATGGAASGGSTHSPQESSKVRRSGSDGGSVPERGRPAFFKWYGWIFVAGALIMSMGFLQQGLADQARHTGRAEAVVSDVTQRGDGSESDRNVYVDYRAEGAQYTGELLDGHARHPEVGDALTVAYDPADPDSIVRPESVEHGPDWVIAGIGIGLLAVSGWLAYRQVATHLRARG